MKIVVIQDYLRMGGTEMQAVSMVAGFQSKGWDAHLLTLRPGGPLLERAERLGLKVNCLQPFDFKLNWAHPGLQKEIHKDWTRLYTPHGEKRKFNWGKNH